MELRVAFRTLGCKLNQLETESLADAFKRSGARIVRFEPETGASALPAAAGPAAAESAGTVTGLGAEPAAAESAGTVTGLGAEPAADAGLGADLYVLNTCTVTSKAEQKARRLIRQALHRRPGAVVLVTGCYAQLEGPAIAALDERAIVVPGDEKAAIASLAGWLAESWQGHGDLVDAVLEWRRSLAPLPPGSCAESATGPSAEAASCLRPELASKRFAFFPEEFAFHSRPSLKIQDGCDNRCSYCRVCLARGPSSSLPAAEILRRLRVLEAAGRAEAVLTGVNLYQYRDGELRFPGLLRYLLAGSERIALRLSSYEPEGVNEDFLEAFALPRVRAHIHLPVQSGSDSVLARMARAYRRDKVLAACEALRRVKAEPFLAADIIAGFPGETEADFEASLELARACRFAWIHAFPFSARPGTRAWEMGGRVPERVAGERVLALSRLAEAGRADYVRRNLGRELEAVLEGGVAKHADVSGGGGLRQATSENYLKLRIEGLPAGLPSGAAVRCRLEAPLGGARSEPRSPDSGEAEGVSRAGESSPHAEALGEADALAAYLAPA